MSCLFGHKWNDSCKCERCGATRDEHHVWKGEKCSRCGKYCVISTIKNQCVLADIAMDKEISLYMRHQAADRLTDQNLLADVAKNAIEVIDERKIREITNQGILFDIANNKMAEGKVRLCAILNLTDQTMLTEIINDKSGKYITTLNRYIFSELEASNDTEYYAMEAYSEDLCETAKERLAKLKQNSK